MTTSEAMGRSTIPWWLVLIQGIAAIIIGILLLTNPAATTVIIIQMLGIYWLIAGIFGIVAIFIDRSGWGWKLFSGIIGILAGIAIIQHPWWSAVLVPTTLVLVMGIFGVIIGITNLIQAFRGGGLGIGILGAVSILIGLWLAFNPLAGALALPFVVGIFAVAGGISALIAAFRMR
jgi:uncharacterized membrane protein HdeD (DUF308 family)